MQALGALAAIDKAIGGNGAFTKVVNDFRISCHPDFVRGLVAIAGYMAEDSLGAGHNPAPSGPVTETAYEGLKKIFGK
ncbi:MAG: hypothetical protein NC489_45425, partial [Ruminococcus flavefaciens]|nr:hypothetical protein [Ruminococcus flavefaciens]